MTRPALIFAAILISIASIDVSARGSGHSGSSYSSGTGSAHVSGYTRKDGTYVAPYTRSAPDGIKSNNLGYSAGGGYSSSSGYSSGRSSSSTDHRSAEEATYEDVKRQITSSKSPKSNSSTSYSSGGIERDDQGRIKRSQAAKSDFKAQSPCPSTGKSSGACPGYVVDHVTPLKRGGADAPSNMQWQTTAEAKAKDRWE